MIHYTLFALVVLVSLLTSLPLLSTLFRTRQYPPKMRIVAIVNMAVLSFLAGIVLIRAGLFFPQFFSFSKIGIWFVVVFSGIGTVLNTITPSKIERIWAPVAGIQLALSIIIAIH